MLLNITASATHKHPATDLGYLLGKHPERWQQKPLSFGTAHVFYPKISPECCTATLLLDIDTTREMRNRRLDHQGRNANVQAGFDQYVTDRAYVAGSLLASAVAKVFGGAMNGKCPQRPELVEAVWPLEIELAAVSVRGSADLLHEVFEPLGYQLSYQQVPLDERFPSWGDSPYYHLRLRNTCTLQRAVQHLYVLLPILDNRKHYFVKEAEVEKLLAKAKDWLATHPKREFITRRYLRHRRNLQRDALAELDATTPPTATEKSSEAILARKTPLHEQRHDAVIRELLLAGAQSVLDLGCSTGKLLKRLFQQPQFNKITGADVSPQALKIAGRQIGLHRNQWQGRSGKAEIIQAALTYCDERFRYYDAAVLVEVIEHLEEERLPALEEVVFGHAKPRLVIVTTPNATYNAVFETLAAGQFRHPDHRFEWDQVTFQAWATGVGERYGYRCTFQAIGAVHEQFGPPPSQMAIFALDDPGTRAN